jgi:acyl carrier protein
MKQFLSRYLGLTQTVQPSVSQTEKVVKDIIEKKIGITLQESLQPLLQKDHVWVKRLVKILKDELFVEIAPQTIASFSNLSELSELVESNLVKNKSGKTLIDVYEIVQTIAKEEYHPKINFSWYAKWLDFETQGNFFTRPDPLDSVEVIIRIEQEFNISISDSDAEKMETVRDLVQYIWQKCVEKPTI